MQRACAASLLRKGITIISNPGHSNDDLAAMEVISQLGAKIIRSDGLLSVTSNGIHPAGNEINCGESGLGFRMFAPIVALADKSMVISGRGSLLSRPMHFFDKVFPLLGVTVHSNNGRLPITVKGPLQPRNIEVDGSLSSQFLTGLLMAFAASGAKGTCIVVKNLTSKPYIDLTLAVMREFGWVVENRNYEAFYFYNQPLVDTGEIRYTVEGDWSGAAFLLVAAALAGPLEIKGLNLFSTQADKAIVSAIEAAGASVHSGQQKILITPAKLQGFQFDATECPDLFPPLVTLGSYCSGVTILKGIHRLTHKESNRALSLQEQFGKMGVEIRLENDNMIILGGRKIKKAVVHSSHDHRIAMACAIAALNAEGPIEIEHAEAVDKSYPDFYQHLQLAGVSLSLAG